MLKRILRKLGLGALPIDRSMPPVMYPDDRYLVSYPRSGNTWLRYLIANLLDPDTDWTESNLQQIVPDLHDYTFLQTDYPRPRYIKSHEPYKPQYTHVLMLYRDGRDVAVSYHNYLRTVRGRSFTFDQFLDALVAGNLPYGSWHGHVESWLGREHSIPFMAVAYEDMCADAITKLTEIARFLEMNVDAARIERAVEKCTFGWYRENVKKHSPHAKSGFQGGVRGGPGKWREVFSDEQLDRFWATAGPTMETLGYPRDPGPA